MKVLVKQQFWGEFARLELAHSSLAMTDIDVVDVRIISSPAEARMQCEAYIEQHYPLWRQMNVLRAGTAEEQARMGRFIDTCRAWSNVEQPDPTELEKLKPE